MPIYENDEHEYLNAKVKKLENNSFINGNLFLTEKRIIFEKNGKRSFIRASPAVTDVNIYLYNIENSTSAIPRFPLFTKKILSFEYYDDNGKLQRIDFAIKDPKTWVNQITRLASLAKKEESNKNEKKRIEENRRELEMAKAKAPKANIGMAIFGDDKNKSKNPYNNIRENIIDNAKDENLPAENTFKCPNCGFEVDNTMTYCPNCGYKLK